MSIMSMFDGLELKQAQDPTDDEILEELRAWGFETVEEFFAALDDEQDDEDET